MEKRLRESLGGTLKPGDPRRFLIEVMIGAMHADGVVDSREMETLRRLLRDHRRRVVDHEEDVGLRRLVDPKDEVRPLPVRVRLEDPVIRLAG